MNKIIFTFISFLFAFSLYAKDISIEELVGVYKRTDDNATIELSLKNNTELYIKGNAVSKAGDVLELDDVANYDGESIIYKCDKYTIKISIIDRGRIEIVEESNYETLDITFDGVYLKNK
ncbi:hypothetical protein [uncultured Brachyspira sp.]|uniref:hypothetical protein n=1 Tax=uncultured Brachyspira sp. TaxID=221953 RepID=UPI0026045187|nr:hypothetical protein [uncultured Brachyspira sp.]